MSSKTKIKFAVIGCGHIGKRHAELINLNPEAELIALCDVKESSTLEIEKFGVPHYQDFTEMLKNHPEIEVVNIATPNAYHSPQAVEALNKGFNVVVEKPLGLSKIEAEKIIFTALHKNKHVFAVMQNRYSPPSIWLKQLVDSGTLGKIYMVQINCYWNRDERYYKTDNWHGSKEIDGGTLFTQFSHFVDIMYWAFGDVDQIQGALADFNHQNLTEFEDSGTVNFNFINGGMGILNFSTSCWDKNFESSLTVVAEKGTLKIGGQYMNEVEYCHIKDYKMPKLAPVNPANDYGPYKGSAANHVHLIENVIDVLKGRDTITTNALEGLKVVDIIERIYKSTKRLST